MTCRSGNWMREPVPVLMGTDPRISTPSLSHPHSSDNTAYNTNPIQYHNVSQHQLVDSASRRTETRKNRQNRRTGGRHDDDEHLGEAVYEPVALERLLERAEPDEHAERAKADERRELVRARERVLEQEPQLLQRRLGLHDVLQRAQPEHRDQLLAAPHHTVTSARALGRMGERRTGWGRGGGDAHHDDDRDGGDEPAEERAAEDDVHKAQPEEPEEEADESDLERDDGRDRD